MPISHSVTSLSLSGAPFFPSLVVQLAPGLNAVIAQRGCGKSSVLHGVRRGIGAPPPATKDEKAKYESLCDANLGTGKSCVTVSANGLTYEAVLQGDGAPTVRHNGVERPDLRLDGELFPCEFYGPHEIEAIAGSPPAQLDLLDRFAAARVLGLSKEIATLEAHLVEGATKIENLESALAQGAALTDELPQIEEALKGLEHAEGPDAAAVAAAHAATERRGRERVDLEALEKALEQRGAALDEYARDSAAAFRRSVDAAHEGGPHGAIFGRAHGSAQRAAGAVETATSQLRDALAVARREIGEERRALAAAHAVEHDRDQAVILRQNEDEARRATRKRLQDRRDELAHAKKIEVERRAALDGLRHKREASLDERARLCHERFLVRRGVVESLCPSLGDDIQLEVLPQADVSKYLQLLDEIATGSNTRKVLLKAVAAQVRPRDLVAAVRAGDIERICAVDPMKDDKEERAGRLVELLQKSGRLHEIEGVALADEPVLLLKTAKGFQRAGGLSTGENCAAVLPIVLLQRSGPLFIDQPEDSVDGTYIYDVLVQTLRRIKANRQIVMVTHNPTLLVLSEPERVFLLGVEDGHSVVRKVGTVDELREDIERLMEGGRAAFLLRAEKYGHLAR